ncbi:hypothetical protein WJX74_000451 [Apatococcus lobatus]|uniref:Uncharacterized protein n=1 Tax=Apatococcus lobatus TaxID=904363 RepID=A0AAW1QK66_9CHLO
MHPSQQPFQHTSQYRARFLRSPDTLPPPIVHRSVSSRRWSASRGGLQQSSALWRSVAVASLLLLLLGVFLWRSDSQQQGDQPHRTRQLASETSSAQCLQQQCTIRSYPGTITAWPDTPSVDRTPSHSTAGCFWGFPRVTVHVPAKS